MPLCMVAASHWVAERARALEVVGVAAPRVRRRGNSEHAGALHDECQAHATWRRQIAPPVPVAVTTRPSVWYQKCSAGPTSTKPCGMHGHSHSANFSISFKPHCIVHGEQTHRKAERSMYDLQPRACRQRRRLRPASMPPQEQHGPPRPAARYAACSRSGGPR